ncbi:hypothetical protein [Parapedobacter deserti]|uniref:hypothetical protein n=1 Tax=Parapedobacter deserti TaxID=1912957 RepID=UPI00366BDBE4
MRDIAAYLPFAVAFFLLLISMVAFRIYYPYSSSSNDFRHIFPAITPLVLLAVAGLLGLRNRKPLFVIAVVVLVAFAASGLLFQVITLAALLGV